MPARCWNSVFVKPGHRAVTVTPEPASSPASPSLNVVTQALAAEYEPEAMKPATDETLTMRPRPRSRIATPAAWDRTSTARVSTSNAPPRPRRRCAGSCGAARSPALLTRTSTGRSGSATRSATVCRADRSERSATSTSAGRHTARQLGGDRLETGTVAGDEHEVVLARGELTGELVPDAGAGAGDEGRGSRRALCSHALTLGIGRRAAV